jgi:flagellar M-ring protein FliF
MEQLTRLLQSLTLKQKISIVVALAFVGTSLTWLVSWRKEAGFRPLYTNMQSEDAGALLQRLKESGVEYRLTNNSTTVLVPAAQIDELRLELAREGLPKSGRIGFEIFDRTQFGTTDFAEHVNYRRALEGELERTIMALAEVERARVHLTFSKDSVFVESQKPAKASVLIQLRRSNTLASGRVLAITHLIASAVEGLAPEAVSVIDRQGRLLSRPRSNTPDELSPPDTMLEYRERIERAMLAKLNQALEPVLGANHFRAGVTVECDLSSSEETEETVDPSQSVMLTMQKSEEVGAGVVPAGVPGTAANLPNPPPTNTSSTGMTRRTENTTFQTSRKVRNVKQPKGSIQRVAVAVLVDYNVRFEQEGEETRRIVEEPAPERLESIRNIAAAVVGLDVTRGDLLTVEAIPFEPNGTDFENGPGGSLTDAQPPTGLWGWFSQLDQTLKIAVAGGVIVVVVVLLLVLRRLFRKVGASVSQATRASLPSGSNTGRANLEQDTALTLQEQTLKALETASHSEEGMETIVMALRKAVQQDSAAAAGVVRSWMVERN